VSEIGIVLSDFGTLPNVFNNLVGLFFMPAYLGCHISNRVRDSEEQKSSRPSRLTETRSSILEAAQTDC